MAREGGISPGVLRSGRLQACRIQCCAGWYVDGEPGGKRREIDLLAMDRAPGCQMGVDVVVECKWSGDKPWVVFSREDPLPPALRTDLAIGTDMACSCFGGGSNHGRDHQARCVFPTEENGVRRPPGFTKGNDLFYEAITSTVSKTCAIADQFKQVEPEDLKSLLTNAMVVLPVIVIDARLLKVSCDSKTAEIHKLRGERGARSLAGIKGMAFLRLCGHCRCRSSRSVRTTAILGCSRDHSLPDRHERACSPCASIAAR